MEKIVAFLKKQKIFIFLFLILLILLIIKLLVKKPDQTIKPIESPAPLKKNQKLIIPEKEPKLKKESPSPGLKEKTSLNLISSYPNPGINETLLDRYKITFTFNQVLTPENISYKITPKISLKTSIEESKLSFYPSTPFLFDTSYILEINGLESIEGDFLNKPVIYQFLPVFPEKLNFDEHH